MARKTAKKQAEAPKVDIGAEIFASLRELEKLTGIPVDYMVERLKQALTGTARYLANVVARNLDTKTRCIELSTLQRCAGHLTSRTDITEAYQVGGAAAKAAFEGVTGQMVALKRISNNPYQCTTELHPISEVANLEKKVPLSWMNNNHTQMTEDFLDYARPLIQAELTPLYIAGLPHHIYMKNQK